MHDKEKAIKEAILFQELSDQEISDLATRSEKKLIKTNDYITKQGDFSAYIYILMKGAAKVILHLEGYEMILSTLKPYAVIGEITFIDKKEISADVIAEEPCLIVQIPHKEIADLMEASPSFAAKIWKGSAKLLAERIRKSKETMRAYFGINKALCENPEFRNFFSKCYYSPR